MNFESVPMIRLELDYMKSSIISTLGLYGSELGEAVKERIEQTIKNYDFNGKVSAIASDVITSEIEAFFKFGNGREYIQSSVQKVLDSVFANKPLNQTDGH